MPAISDIDVLLTLDNAGRKISQRTWGNLAHRESIKLWREGKWIRTRWRELGIPAETAAEKQRISRLLRRMAASGLIERATASGERLNVVRLAPGGLALLADLPAPKRKRKAVVK